MIRAFVLGKVMPNAEAKVVEAIKKIKGVRSADITFGKYDLIVSLELNNESALKNILIEEIRKIPEVTKTLTLIGAKTF